MNGLKQTIVGVLIVMLTAGLHTSAQVPPPPSFQQELARLETALTILKESTKPGPASAGPDTVRPGEPLERRALLQAMLQDLARIDKALPPSWAGEETYTAAFRGYADMVNAIARADPGLADARQLQAIRDLHGQLGELRVALYSGLGMDSQQLRGPTVAVTIKAKANGREIEGLQVRCSPFALRTTHPDFHLFKKLTTTAAEQLMPGRYQFRVFRNNELLSAGTYAVGLRGEREELIELPIPERK